MAEQRRRPNSRTLASLSILICGASLLAACSTSTLDVAEPKKRSKEFFAESEYGVRASPRVTTQASNLPRGGGRDQIGRPYQVRGQWYRPKEDPNYRSTGLASWYGDAFHGRLTANGEIYDKTHLTAAHPTMPLPSYARVTNKVNGHSVIVRVNDRGPFARGRVIDLSQRAAEVLDYKNSGVAQVSVEYVGRAPLHGLDDAYLMASFTPGGQAPSDGLPTGVMMAMNGATPTAQPASQAAGTPFAVQGGAHIVLPDFAPIAPARPSGSFASAGQGDSALLAYGELEAEGGAAGSFGAHLLSVSAGSAMQPGTGAASFVNAGTFASKAEAVAAAAQLSALGRTSIDADPLGEWYGVSIAAHASGTLDTVLRASWAAGFTDAMIVRE